CSSDDSSTVNEENTETQMSIKSVNEVDLIVAAFSETIDAKIKKMELSDEELSQIFLDNAKGKNIKIQDLSELEEVNLGNEFLNYANKIKNTDFEEHTEYLVYLDGLKSSLSRDSKLSDEEKVILTMQVDFSVAAIQM